MDDFQRIFERMDIKQLRTFILCGMDEPAIDMRSYEQKLKEESEPLYMRLESLYPDRQERDDFLSDIAQVLAAYEQVYLEIGMRAGARLLFQLLKNE